MRWSRCGLLRHLRWRVLCRQGSAGGRRRVRSSRGISVFLTTYASKVTFLVREQDFTCDATVAAAAKSNPKIDVRYQIELEGVTVRQGGLREASILNRATGQTETWKPADGGTFGVFVFAGYVPATDLVRGVASSYVYTALSVSSSTCSMTLSTQRV